MSDSPSACLVGTIGHLAHGKTTLTAALLNHCARRTEGVQRTVEWVAGPEALRSNQRFVTVRKRQFEFDTPQKRYHWYDCPGHPDYLKNTITGLAQVDHAVLVVSSTEGPLPQTREHLFLA